MVSATLNRIDRKLAEVEPGGLRHQTLAALRQFRASWVELGRLLNAVAYGGDYKEWGYDEFELYCARELGLKMPTVQKLMVSYNYMKSHEPARLRTIEDEPDAGASVPDYQTVELLDRARRRAEAGDLDEDAAEELHRRAFVGEDDETVLRKEIRERLRPDAAPDGDGRRPASGLGGLQRMARALRERLAGAEEVPDALRGRLEGALLELEEL